jgi:hypothetical protein
MKLLALLPIRNTHSAFQGAFTVVDPPADTLALVWTNDEESPRLDVNLTDMCASITCSRIEAAVERAVASQSTAAAPA